jgi:hypothetical protein
VCANIKDNYLLLRITITIITVIIAIIPSNTRRPVPWMEGTSGLGPADVK